MSRTGGLSSVLGMLCSTADEGVTVSGTGGLSSVLGMELSSDANALLVSPSYAKSAATALSLLTPVSMTIRIRAGFKSLGSRSSFGDVGAADAWWDVGGADAWSASLDSSPNTRVGSSLAHTLANLFGVSVGKGSCKHAVCKWIYFYTYVGYGRIVLKQLIGLTVTVRWWLIC